MPGWQAVQHQRFFSRPNPVQQRRQPITRPSDPLVDQAGGFDDVGLAGFAVFGDALVAGRLGQRRAFFGPGGETGRAAVFPARVGVRVGRACLVGGQRDLRQRRRREVRPHFGERSDAAVPIAVQLDFSGMAGVVAVDDVERVAALVAAGFVSGGPRGAMQRLVDVADEMDDEAQRLGALDRVGGGFQRRHVVFQGVDDVGFRRPIRQGGMVGAEELVDVMHRRGKRILGQVFDLVGPHRGADKVLAFLPGAGRAQRDGQEFCRLLPGVGVQPLLGDVGGHHVPARPPAPGGGGKGRSQQREADEGVA